MTTIRQRGGGEELAVGSLAAVTGAGRRARGAVSDPRFAMAQYAKARPTVPITWTRLPSLIAVRLSPR
jgi:hypothetical protein